MGEIDMDSLLEKDIQKMLVQWLDANGIDDYVHVANEQVLLGGCKGMGSKMKIISHARSMGARKGFPDLIFPQRRWALELKRKRNRVRPFEQTEWLLKLERWGWRASFAHGYEDAVSIIEGWIADDKKGKDKDGPGLGADKG